jgi:2-oxoglutarate ferredoxin oxidoreductase subunit gamma
MRTEILLGGSGGQGLILAGYFLAEAAVLYEGKNATHNQSYGLEARGGRCKSEVIISDSEINYAQLTKPDVLLAMTQDSFDLYAPLVKNEGLIIIDSTLVDNTENIDAKAKIESFPITEMAFRKTATKITANVTALGILTRLTKVISIENIEREVAAKAPLGTAERNLMALRCGYDYETQGEAGT